MRECIALFLLRYGLLKEHTSHYQNKNWTNMSDIYSYLVPVQAWCLIILIQDPGIVVMCEHHPCRTKYNYKVSR